MAAKTPAKPTRKNAEVAKKREPSYFQRFTRKIRTRLIGGVLLVIPLAVTWFIVKFLYTISVGALVPLLQQFHFGESLPPFAIPAMALVATLAFLYLVGFLAGNYLGKRVINLGEAILRRIPVVKTVYSASKQIVDTFSLQSNKGFKRVALFEFPRKGLYVLGFVTGDLLGPNGERMYCIFVATTPNPTSGYLEVVPAKDTILLDMTIEEAVKMIMSGGILAPPQLVASARAAGCVELAEVDDVEA